MVHGRFSRWSPVFFLVALAGCGPAVVTDIGPPLPANLTIQFHSLDPSFSAEHHVTWVGQWELQADDAPQGEGQTEAGESIDVSPDELNSSGGYVTFPTKTGLRAGYWTLAIEVTAGASNEPVASGLCVRQELFAGADILVTFTAPPREPNTEEATATCSSAVGGSAPGNQ